MSDISVAMSSPEASDLAHGHWLRQALVRAVVALTVVLVVLAQATAAWSWPTCD